MRSSRKADVPAVGDSSMRRALTCLRGGPQFVVHDAQRRRFLCDPVRRRIQSRDALTGIRILDVAQSIPDRAADVKLVVQDSGSTLRVAVNRARTPASAKRTGDPVPIESLGDRFRRNPSDEVTEDPFYV